MIRSQRSAGTHRHHHGNGSSEAPDQSVVQRQPTEIRVSVAFGVQAHGQTCRQTQKNLFLTFGEIILYPEEVVAAKVTKVSWTQELRDELNGYSINLI